MANKPRDVYQEAQAHGKVWAGQSDLPQAYWAARYAARETATALLEEAARIGIPKAKIEQLREVAREVAYD